MHSAHHHPQLRKRNFRIGLVLSMIFGLCSLASSSSADEATDFFEARIRPVLIEHCYECHSVETEASGGLLLDSREGWQTGGDSGAAVVPGDPSASRLLKALTYEDPHLQMPPETQLPPQVLRDFQQWIAAGAVDPREGSRPATPKATGLAVEQAQDHWAYRDVQPVEVPPLTSQASSDANPVDAFIYHRLQSADLVAAPLAESQVLVRRLYVDLLGLPPTAAELKAATRLINTPGGYAVLVEQLLESMHYGEHFARKWMDVVRYADSITLRGFVLPEAWRYRDYLINAFAQDRPFDQMIREQVAGDLLPYQDLEQRQSQLIATGFLVLGNTNLEEQDKTQLEMDYIDEQLEVLGRAFLGQTIGCARCHDHKFDPIPTRDYYALAGILRSTVALQHENVSQWVEQPLPLPPEEEMLLAKLSAEKEQLQQQLSALAKPHDKRTVSKVKSVPRQQLKGIVIDDTMAKLVGQWKSSTAIGTYVDGQYLHDENMYKGQKTATFEPNSLAPGQYEVRLAYTAGTNRASNALVRVFSADGEATRRINQRQAPSAADPFVSLGIYRFEKDGQSFVLINNEDSDGVVVVDAVQFIPVENSPAASSTAASSTAANAIDSAADISSQERPPRPTRSAAAQARQAAKAVETEQQIKHLEDRLKELDARLAARPKYLTLLQSQQPQDIPIHIRGDVHNLGQTVPRGFLTALNRDSTPRIAPSESGRVELAQWLSSADNPLTARVYANRVWTWLMGQGLVSSVNNFGTTGTPPSHPELLDWLAGELVRSGWSTKHLVRLIVTSDAYRRQSMAPDEKHQQLDPNNTLYWSGQTRRLSAEALRDAMLRISGELDTAAGGSLIRGNTKADYNYQHGSTRRSIYHPVFRNSLPELYEQFDFADPSMSIGERSRSTVATQALVLLNHPWIVQRVAATANRLRHEYPAATSQELVRSLYLEILSRLPTPAELNHCVQFLQPPQNSADNEQTAAEDRLQMLVHSLFASLDFRYLD